MNYLLRKPIVGFVQHVNLHYEPFLDILVLYYKRSQNAVTVYLRLLLTSIDKGCLMSNIYDIAEKTGFSPSTVARALSGKGYVGAKTKSVIFEAAEKTGYRPSHSARSLRSKKTFKILM